MRFANIQETSHELYLSWFNSSWTSDAICRHRFESTLVQVMTCCLTAPSHYQNQCWLILRFQWHSFRQRLTDTVDMNHKKHPEISFYKISQGQRVSDLMFYPLPLWCSMDYPVILDRVTTRTDWQAETKCNITVVDQIAELGNVSHKQGEVTANLWADTHIVSGMPSLKMIFAAIMTYLCQKAGSIE